MENDNLEIQKSIEMYGQIWKCIQTYLKYRNTQNTEIYKNIQKIQKYMDIYRNIENIEIY